MTHDCGSHCTQEQSETTGRISPSYSNEKAYLGNELGTKTGQDLLKKLKIAAEVLKDYPVKNEWVIGRLATHIGENEPEYCCL